MATNRRLTQTAHLARRRLEKSRANTRCAYALRPHAREVLEHLARNRQTVTQRYLTTWHFSVESTPMYPCEYVPVIVDDLAREHSTVYPIIYDLAQLDPDRPAHGHDEQNNRWCSAGANLLRNPCGIWAISGQRKRPPIPRFRRSGAGSRQARSARPIRCRSRARTKKAFGDHGRVLLRVAY